MGTNICYKIDNGNLNIQTPLFSMQFCGVEKVSAAESNGGGLSLPYVDILAEGDGRVRHYCVWEDLPLVYMPDHGEAQLLTLKGQHWLIRSIQLNAFTDANDTLTEESESHMYAGGLFSPKQGEIFFLENPEDGQAAVIISETPDYQTAELNIKNGVVTVENGGNGLAIGFCRMGECKALCRNYYRHARRPRTLVTMSNTWGDRNGVSRVCRDFVLREIDAAKELGIDIVQIDDGWQVGSTADLSRRDEQGRREFSGNFWDVSQERFPGSMLEIADYAAKDGIKVGLWFAPDSHDSFALLERDKAILRRAYEEWGFRFFKLDMFWVTSDTDRDRFLELLREIYSFGDDVAVQLDVTRDLRTNYLCGRQYGTVFVENRYTRSGNAFPHRVLRNLWMLGQYLPTAKFQFELVNPDLNKESYGENDPFAPSLYDMDYLFAAVMLSNPLFWMEMQFLPQQRRDELKRIMPVWRACRDVLSGADVMPIGEKPSGRSFTGFCVSTDGEPKYLLLFREATENSEVVIPAPVKAAEVRILASNADASVKVTDGAVYASFSKPRAYAFVEL